MSERKHSKGRDAKKICELSPDSDSKELRIFTENPAYVCRDCGRSAASQEHLCQPERMFSAW